MRKVFKWGSSSSKCQNFGLELAQAAKALGRLSVCVGLSEHSLFAYVKSIAISSFLLFSASTGILPDETFLQFSGTMNTMNGGFVNPVNPVVGTNTGN